MLSTSMAASAFCEALCWYRSASNITASRNGDFGVIGVLPVDDVDLGYGVVALLLELGAGLPDLMGALQRAHVLRRGGLLAPHSHAHVRLVSCACAEDERSASQADCGPPGCRHEGSVHLRR